VRRHTVLSYYVYAVSSCLVGDFCGLARTRGPCSQDTFTLDATILAKSYTYWRKRKEGPCCGHHTTNHALIDAISSQAPTIPPSLPLPQTVVPSITGDTRAVCDLLSSLPGPDANKETTRLAREAVRDGLKALLRLMEFVQMPVSTIRGTEELAHELGALTADLPTQITLPILLNAYEFTSERGAPRSFASILSLPEERYRVGCLTGFGRAEVYGGRWTESGRRAHGPTGALVGGG